MFENPTVNLNALCNSCAKIACCSSELIFTFLYAGSSIQNASELFVSTFLFSTSRFIQKVTRLGLDIYIYIYIYIYIDFEGLSNRDYTECAHFVTSGQRLILQNAMKRR
jgi:hypothetical protein